MYQAPINIHFYQKDILANLALNPKLSFSKLNIEGLESEHMNYHLKKLIDLGFVQKKGSSYTLTDAGKDYSNLMDDDMKKIEKQPKTSVIINAVRENEKSGKVEFLLSRRLRQPYFRKVGRLTGKVRFGETLWEAVERELFEETGLKAEEYILEEIYHKIRYQEEGKIVQDVLFYIFYVKGLKGSMIEKTKYQENFWVSNEEVENNSEYDVYDDLNLDPRLEPKRLSFSEKKQLAEDY